jgi:hypothetical protein
MEPHKDDADGQDADPVAASAHAAATHTASARAARAVRAIGVGACCFVAGGVVLFSPLLWGPRFSYNKYFVVVGLILGLLGVSMSLNGALDWLAAKRRRGQRPR